MSTEVCPPEKPICFRKGHNNKKKSIEYRCNGQKYEIFGAMNQAFYINDGKKDEELKKKLDGDDSVNQCAVIEGQKLNLDDCFCSPFDFTWISAISEAKRRIGGMAAEKLINKPTKAATKEVAETMEKSMTKPNLTIFFTHISFLMKKNIPKITQGNPIYVEIFCACLDGALSNTTKDIVNVIENIIKKAIVKPPNEIVSQGTTIYNSLKEIVEIEKTINSVITNTNIADEIEKTMETQLNKTVPNNNELNELNQKLTDTVKLIHIGNYVTNNSNHFDKNAFDESVETFQLFLFQDEGQKKALVGGGKIWDYVKTNKWNILGGIVAGCAAAAALVTPVGWAATVVGVVIGAVKVYVNYREKKNAIREAIAANDTEIKEKCASILAASENTDSKPADGGKKRHVSKKKQTKRKRKYNISKKYNKKYIKKYKTRRK